MGSKGGKEKAAAKDGGDGTADAARTESTGELPAVVSGLPSPMPGEAAGATPDDVGDSAAASGVVHLDDPVPVVRDVSTSATSAAATSPVEHAEAQEHRTAVAPAAEERSVSIPKPLPFPPANPSTGPTALPPANAGDVKLSAKENRIPHWLACGHSAPNNPALTHHVCVEAEGEVVLDGIVKWGAVKTLQIRAEAVVFGEYVEGLHQLEMLYVNARSVDMTRLFAAHPTGWVLPSLHTFRMERVEYLFVCPARQRCGHIHLVLPNLAVLELPRVGPTVQESLCFALEGAVSYFGGGGAGLSALPAPPASSAAGRSASPRSHLTHPHTSLPLPNAAGGGGGGGAREAATRLGPIPSHPAGVPHLPSHLRPLPDGPDVELVV